MEQRTMAWPSCSLGSVTPMPPCSRPCTCRVTKTPHRSEKTPSEGMTSGSPRCKTASRIAWRANSSAACRSASERHSILRLLAGFEHAQLAALLDAVVHVAPEAQEVLRGRYHGANHHEPEENEPQGPQRRMPCAYDHDGHGTDLQDHLGLTQGGGRDREALGGSDVSEAKHGELASNDDDDHPCGHQRFTVAAVHVHQCNERSGNQQFIGDGVEENPESGYLQPPPR